MKNMNLKPLYIFLAVVGTAAFLKLSQPEAALKGIVYNFEKQGDYVNSFEEDMHESASDVKEGINDLKKEAAKKEMDVVIPTYND